jgi:hypothetical protein
VVTAKTPAPGLSAVDRDALERAVELMKADDDAQRRDQIAQKLHAEDWFTAAHFAAYYRQREVLDLKPWESPPCYGDSAPGHDGHADAAKLLKKLLDAGLSKYEPDPLRVQ